MAKTIYLFSKIKEVNVLRNLTAVMVRNIITRAVGLFSIMYLARVFGPEALGVFNFAFAVIGYFSIIVSFGLDDFGILHVASDPTAGNIEKHVGNLLGLRLTISAVCFLALFVAIYFVPQFFRYQSLFMILGLNLFIQAFNIEWLYIAIERMEFVAAASAISRLLYLVLLLILIKSPEDILICGFVAVLSEIWVPVLLVFFYTRFDRKLKIIFNIHQFWFTLRYNLPLSVASLIGLVRMNGDLVILGFLVAPNEVGLYAAILGLTNVGILFSSMLRQVMYSRIVRSFKSQTLDQFGVINFVCLKYGIIFGLLIGLLGSFFAPQIIITIFGDKFLKAVPSFRIIIWVVALNFMGISLPHALMAYNRNQYFKVNLLSGALNLILNFVSIPLLGIMGAALSYLISTILWITSFYYFVCKKTVLFSLDLFALLAKPLISFCICGIFVSLSKSVNPYIILFLSTFIYIYILFVTRYLSLSGIKSDLRAI